jgi:AraC family transcriptional regulator
MEIRIEHVPPMKVAYVRHHGPYDTCCQAWGRIYNWAGRNNFIRPGTLGIGASYDDPETTPPEKIRYDACLTCKDDFAANGDVEVQTLGGGQYVTAVHRGSYQKIKDSFRYLMSKWLPLNGRRMRDAPCLEIYLDDPGNTPEAEVRTKLCVPVE